MRALVALNGKDGQPARGPQATFLKPRRALPGWLPVAGLRHWLKQLGDTAASFSGGLLLVIDPSKGFLPVNDGTGIGDGFVSYTIQPKSTIQSGDVIQRWPSEPSASSAPWRTPPRQGAPMSLGNMRFGERAHARRGAADRGEHCEGA